MVGLRAAQEAAEQELNRARAAHLPTLDLSASYGDSDSVGAVGSPADITTRVRGQGQVAAPARPVGIDVEGKEQARLAVVR